MTEEFTTRIIRTFLHKAKCNKSACHGTQICRIASDDRNRARRADTVRRRQLNFGRIGSSHGGGGLRAQHDSTRLRDCVGLPAMRAVRRHSRAAPLSSITCTMRVTDSSTLTSATFPVSSSRLRSLRDIPACPTLPAKTAKAAAPVSAQQDSWTSETAPTPRRFNLRRVAAAFSAARGRRRSNRSAAEVEKPAARIRKRSDQTGSRIDGCRSLSRFLERARRFCIGLTIEQGLSVDVQLPRHAGQHRWRTALNAARTRGAASVAEG